MLHGGKDSEVSVMHPKELKVPVEYHQWGEGFEDGALLQMRQKHRGRISPPYLQRMNVKIVLKIIHVQQQLSGFANSGDGFK